MTNRHYLLPDDIAALQHRFGATVKSYRMGLGLSQEELSWRAGMHRTYLADIERGGRNISLTRIVQLVRALGVSPSEFFYHLDKPTPSLPLAVPVPRSVRLRGKNKSPRPVSVARRPVR